MSDKPSGIELLKLLIASFVKVVVMIVRNNWEPFYTTTVKMALVSLVLWGLAILVPHGIPFLSGISYLGWMTILIVFRLVTIKYDDFDDPDLAEINTDAEDEQEYEAEQRGLPVRSADTPIRNVVGKREEENDNSSTRE